MSLPPYQFEDDSYLSSATERLGVVITIAQRFSLQGASQEVEPAHLLRALASVDYGVGYAAIQGAGLDLVVLLPEIRELTPSSRKLPPLVIPNSDDTRRLVENAQQAARDLGEKYLGTEHLALGLVKDHSPAGMFLRDRGASYASILSEVNKILKSTGAEPPSFSPGPLSESR